MLISNTVSIERYNPHKQKLLEIRIAEIREANKRIVQDEDKEYEGQII